MARLRDNPSWRVSYLRAMLTIPSSPAAVVGQIVHASLDPAIDTDHRVRSDGLVHLVRTGNYRMAAAAITPAWTVRVRVVVPSTGCVAQWVGIDTPPGGSVSAWIDTLRLRSTTTR